VADLGPDLQHAADPARVSVAAEAVGAAPELEESWLAGCLSALVATPSVTGVDSERAMVERIAAFLEPAGCELTVVESLPDRPSLAAVLRGSGGGPRLVLNGHMDTVPPDDLSLWTVDPFGGALEEGAVWGRGALMKGGLVCQIACAHVLPRLPARPRGTLVLHFACGEETGERGTLSLLERGFTGDVGITTEPTALAVAVAQRGTAYFRILIRGRSAHASTPEAGRNPLLALPAIIEALERYGAETGARRHPLLPPATCTPTMVRAGVQQNAVPDTCELVVDRRLLPGDTPEGALRELQSVVGGAATVEPLHHPFAPSEIPAGSPFVARVLDAVEAVTGRREPVIGTPYGSDVRNLINDAGIEAVTFGPGDVRGAHCPDEHLDLAELRAAATVIATLAVELLA
jgi:succinyl-diaminopimelate desuccinylase